MTDFLIKLKYFICTHVIRRKKNIFLASIAERGRLLDVGCGNDSPYKVKSARPDCYYVGLDIGIYNQTMKYSKCSDELILTHPDRFHLKIQEYSAYFDGILCSHNLEHCNDYMAVTLAMIRSLKKGGAMYLSFPCEESATFPSRPGTLNFYDDPTHKNLIPYLSFLAVLKDNGMDILFAVKRHRPFVLFFIGLLCEPFCRLLRKQAPAGASWALYGFESIIIAKKI